MEKIASVSPSIFLENAKTTPVIDVRSPGEYAEGHIPGTFNLPLFDNDERSIIGTLYKNSGKEAAVLEGLGIAGKKLQNFVKQARRIAPERKILVHCWRGGMRSESMAWLLSTAGFDVCLLQGGYKAWRKFIRDSWEKECRLIVLSGKTGSGKTEILRAIEAMGQQVLDLEKHANHKGSAFGAIGESPQPTNEQFENNLCDSWLKLDFTKPVWVEDESRFIGKVNIPERLYNLKQRSFSICIEMPVELRVERLIADYTRYPKELLLHSLNNLSRRLGGDKVKIAADAIENGDFATAIGIVLTYYDKTYTYDLEKKEGAEILMLNTQTSDANSIARQILEQPGIQKY